MNQPDTRIVKFINNHRVLTLATCSEGYPWCAPCYYVFMEEEMAFIINSDPESRHIRESMMHAQVAGTILLESDIAGKMQGIQFEGKLRIPENNQLSKIQFSYLKNYPLTAPQVSNFWVIDILQMKFTNNRLGSSTMLNWKK